MNVDIQYGFRWIFLPLIIYKAKVILTVTKQEVVVKGDKSELLLELIDISGILNRNR